jgi:hypothetical protein
MRDAQHAAITLGVLLDKAGTLELSAEQAEARSVRLSEPHGQLITTILLVFFEAVGLPLAEGSPPRKLIAGMLRQAGRGEVISPDGSLAEQSRSWLRDRVVSSTSPEQFDAEVDELVSKLREAAAVPPAERSPEEVVEGEPVEASRRVLPALPPGGSTEPRELTEMGEPRRVVRAVPPSSAEVSRPGEWLSPRAVLPAVEPSWPWHWGSGPWR